MGALLFDGTDDRCERDSAVVASPPFTVALWFRPANLTSDYTLVSLPDKDAAADYYDIGLDGTAVGEPIRATAREAGSTNEALSTAGPTDTTTWRSATAIYASATDRRAFFDGGNKGTNSTSRTPAGVDRFSVGRNGRSAPFGYFGGHMAWVFVWNVALDDADVAAWHGGDLAQQASMVAAWDFTLAPAGSVYADVIGNGHDLTVSGATFASGETYTGPDYASEFPADPVAYDYRNFPKQKIRESIGARR